MKINVLNGNTAIKKKTTRFLMGGCSIISQNCNGNTSFTSHMSHDKQMDLEVLITLYNKIRS